MVVLKKLCAMLVMSGVLLTSTVALVGCGDGADTKKDTKKEETKKEETKKEEKKS